MNAAPETKRCRKCGEIKLRAEFNKATANADGLNACCRPCHRLISNESRRRHLDTYAAKQRRWRRGNPQAEEAAKRRWIQANPSAQQMKRAQKVLRNAVRRGELVRPEICAECASEGATEAHHADYEKPLEVDWLCKRCHLARHGKVLRHD